MEEQYCINTKVCELPENLQKTETIIKFKIFKQLKSVLLPYLSHLITLLFNPGRSNFPQ